MSWSELAVMLHLPGAWDSCDGKQSENCHLQPSVPPIPPPSLVPLPLLRSPIPRGAARGLVFVAAAYRAERLCFLGGIATSLRVFYDVERVNTENKFLFNQLYEADKQFHSFSYCACFAVYCFSSFIF